MWKYSTKKIKEGLKMIKIRLHGLPEEVEQAKEQLKKIFDVNVCSAPYKDRGDSKYVRVYIEAKGKNTET